MSIINKNISRRNLIRNSGMTGAALTIGFFFPAWAKETGEIISGGEAEGLGIELTSWISIDKTGRVTLLKHRAEMGQGSYQVVPQMIAEELEVSLDQVNYI